MRCDGLKNLSICSELSKHQSWPGVYVRRGTQGEKQAGGWGAKGLVSEGLSTLLRYSLLVIQGPVNGLEDLEQGTFSPVAGNASVYG